MFLSAAEVRVGGCLERVGGCLQLDSLGEIGRFSIRVLVRARVLVDS